MKHKEATKPKNFFIVHICVMIPTIIFSIIFLINIVKIINMYQLYSNANFTQEYATVVKYKSYPVGNYIHYTTYYEFEGIDGALYTGYWKSSIRTEEEAKAQIGIKVPIYIDQKLGLQTKSLVFSPNGAWFNGIMSLLLFAIFLNSFIREILFIKKLRIYKKSMKETEKIY